MFKQNVLSINQSNAYELPEAVVCSSELTLWQHSRNLLITNWYQFENPILNGIYFLGVHGGKLGGPIPWCYLAKSCVKSRSSYEMKTFFNEQ